MNIDKQELIIFDRKIKINNKIWAIGILEADNLVRDILTWKRFGIHTFGPFVEETR